MIKYHESVFYNSLNELQETYKPNHPDILLDCYTIVK
jgi:hypothetical protein